MITHTLGEALFRAVRTEVWLRDWKDGCSGCSGTLLLWFDVVCSAVITCYWRFTAISHTAVLQRSAGLYKLSIISVEQKKKKKKKALIYVFWLVWNESFKAMVCGHSSELWTFEIFLKAAKQPKKFFFNLSPTWGMFLVCNQWKFLFKYIAISSSTQLIFK